ncbi:site-specific DNA-adenine methylase [Janthinobacterium sp. 35]|uniref:DNA adenine methylase n=1 Tax=Janthinobacterium sp. 35 TaxID=2035210 RepID=UPI000C6969DA|nr:DNA adenine methylase [Janthinobacterium sp. 35]PIG28804.1 site-specific DNA-adenine methylase [Janthinobacterium sp. 35]
MANSTPLRYPGGKARLRPYVEQLLLSNDIADAHYVEPFCGGAGLALELLFRSIVNTIHLNDFDRAIYAFWKTAVYDTENLCRLIRDTECSMKTWYAMREIWRNKNNEDILNLGFATFFLNRTNRSGILAAGVIGGKEQDGKWKIDARYNREDLIKRIELLGMNREKIKIYNLDAKDFLLYMKPLLPNNSLIYLDPPYVEKGPGLYLNHYSENDHRDLANLVKNKLNFSWMVSYDDHPLVRECYGESAEVEMNFPYSAYGNARRGNELVYFSKNLKSPEMMQKNRRYQQPWDGN